MTESFISETTVSEFFGNLHDLEGGGPPPMLSICQGALALLSQAIRPSTLAEMNSLISEEHSNPDEMLILNDDIESSSNASDDH
jgi:hypothetical protein